MFWACAMWKNTNDARLCWILQRVPFVLGRFNVWHVEVKRLSLMMPPKGPVPKYQPRLANRTLLHIKDCSFWIVHVFLFRKAFNLLQVGRDIYFFLKTGGCEVRDHFLLPIFFLGESKLDANLYGRFFLGDFPWMVALFVFFVGIFNDPVCETAMDFIMASASTIFQLPDRQMTSDEMRRSPRILFHRSVLSLKLPGTVPFFSMPLTKAFVHSRVNLFDTQMKTC